MFQGDCAPRLNVAKMSAAEKSAWSARCAARSSDIRFCVQQFFS